MNMNTVIVESRVKKFTALLQQAVRKQSKINFVHTSGGGDRSKIWCEYHVTGYMVRVASTKFVKGPGTDNYAVLKACMLLHQCVVANNYSLERGKAFVLRNI